MLSPFGLSYGFAPPLHDAGSSRLSRGKVPYILSSCDAEQNRQFGFPETSIFLEVGSSARCPKTPARPLLNRHHCLFLGSTKQRITKSHAQPDLTLVGKVWVPVSVSRNSTISSRRFCQTLSAVSQITQFDFPLCPAPENGVRKSQHRLNPGRYSARHSGQQDQNHIPQAIPAVSSW